MKFNFKVLFFLSLAVNLIILVWVPFHLNSVNSKEEEGSQKYPLLSKRIFAEDQNDLLINFVPLRESLREFTNKKTNMVSIYFEYLPSGTSIGINEKEPFFAASLLKLPVAMKTYKSIEEGSIQNSQELTVQAEDIDNGFGDLWKKGIGTKITVEEAVRLSISESDNTADNLLRRLLIKRPVSDVFDYLDIPINVPEGPGAGVTAKNYSSVLRALYLSAYLDRENSNKLLDIMTTSVYRDRLVAGVPKDIKVAHKVGIYRDPRDLRTQTHSDCGIVYSKSRPYMLCIMTKSELQESDTFISEISKLVYKYVSAHP